jgi:hypothetical protein
MKVKLSERVRANSEAAPWVIEAIKYLESQLETGKPTAAWLLTSHDGTDQIVTNLHRTVKNFENAGWTVEELVVRT